MKRANPTNAPTRMDIMMYPINYRYHTSIEEIKLRTVAIHEQKHNTVTDRELNHMDQAPQQLLQHDHYILLPLLIHVSPCAKELFFIFLGQDVCLGLQKLVPLAQVSVELSLETAQEFERDYEKEGTKTGEEKGEGGANMEK